MFYHGSNEIQYGEWLTPDEIDYLEGQLKWCYADNYLVYEVN